ncbi:MAG: hypothetical protein DLM55_03210 [Acidimicrobiales bacterium]|nr:MAG: hypothetical protein DLM55_03210 [Acidimicrobiales bacterium]
MPLSAALLLGLLAAPAFAESAGAAPLCRIADPRLAELSGLVATASGYAAVSTGGTEVKVYLLDRECAISKTLISPQDPFDPEDLARTSDGTLWVADIGDNNRERQSLVIWQVNPVSGVATRHRLAYPDGPHDAEALLMPENKVPLIVTKERSGAAKIYTAVQSLGSPSAAIGTLRAAGTLTISASGTAGGPSNLGTAAQLLITGGAVSPDGKRVALRTYTDAYEWDIADGGISAALASGKSRRTPLAGEPHGAAISYTTDGGGFLTVSGGEGQSLQQWTPAGAAKGHEPHKSDTGGGGFSLPELNRSNLLNGIYAVAALGMLLLVSGVVGIVRFRRGGGSLVDDSDADAEHERGHVSPAELSRPTPAAAGQTRYSSSPRRPFPEPPPPPGGAVSTRGTVYGSNSIVDQPTNSKRGT